jgi:HEAT repeat protein
MDSDAKRKLIVALGGLGLLGLVVVRMTGETRRPPAVEQPPPEEIFPSVPWTSERADLPFRDSPRGQRAEESRLRSDLQHRLAALRERRRERLMGDLQASSIEDAGARATPAGEPESAEDDEAVLLEQLALSDPDPAERAGAIAMLQGSVDYATLISVLMQALSDPDSEVRLMALTELWWVVGENDVPLEPLARSLSDPDPEIRLAALRVLGELREDGIDALAQAFLSDPDEGVRVMASSLIDDSG